MRHANDSTVSTAWLSRFVERAQWIVPTAGRPLEVERLPDGRTTLIVRVLEGTGAGDVTVAGPRTHALFKRATGVARVVTVRFKPGWSVPMLGVAAHALTDKMVLLDDLWGRAGRDLTEVLVAARSVPEVIDRLSYAITLRAHHAVEPASARLARGAVQLLEGGEARVDHVATRLGVTARHLRRAFTESIGIGPKDFARTVRLQRALQRAETSSDWGSIALDAGYYDQAHLIAEFRKLVGFTPGMFAKRATDPMFARPGTAVR